MQGRPDLDIGRILERFAFLVISQRLVILVTQDQAIIGPARVLDHHPMHVGVAQEVFDIDPAGLHQLIDERGCKETIGPRPHA